MKEKSWEFTYLISLTQKERENIEKDFFEVISKYTNKPVGVFIKLTEEDVK